MNYIDIFNGDADGIISLLQLRLANPVSSLLITGVKRDIQLLEKIEANCDDFVTVLDISMEKNQQALLNVLGQGAQVFYADHHRYGELVEHIHLESHLNLEADTCTSLIINNYLNHKYQLWAIVGAYGDNLNTRADKLCADLSLSQTQSDYLKELGTLLNYNSYGAQITDLHFHPAVLYQQLMAHCLTIDASPFTLKNEINSVYYRLKTGYESDLKQAQSEPIYHSSQILDVYLLPYMDWSRRINGPFSNFVANQNSNKAHAVLTENIDGSYVVSLRSPLNNKQGADIICSQFETGGGRSAAAGINKLPQNKLTHFIDVAQTYWLK